MRSLLRTGLVLCVAVMLALPLFADEAKKKKKKPGKGKKDPTAAVFRFPKKIQLTAEQQNKLEQLKKEYAPKLLDAKKAADSVVPAEKIKARNEAVKKAKAEGKTKKEIAKIARQAYSLTKEEKKQLREAKKAFSTILKEIQQKKLALLTEDQKSQLKKKKKKKDK